ncbi:MAG: cyclic pyranopterin monophosphate synthase MoaC [Planctomycetota bacterium]|jgi:cyclic pyranopterin phosphate synthase
MAKPKQGMMDVSEKGRTRRVAVAEAILRADEETVRALTANALPKADPLPTARAAALLAVKETPRTIPHCHPIAVTDVEVEFAVGTDAVTVRCRVATVDRTGVEMEALCGASVACLTLYDMLKGVCPGAEIARVRLLRKSGGQSGDWRAEEDHGQEG